MKLHRVRTQIKTEKLTIVSGSAPATGGQAPHSKPQKRPPSSTGDVKEQVEECRPKANQSKVPAKFEHTVQSLTELTWEERYEALCILCKQNAARKETTQRRDEASLQEKLRLDEVLKQALRVYASAPQGKKNGLPNVTQAMADKNNGPVDQDLRHL